MLLKKGSTAYRQLACDLIRDNICESKGERNSETDKDDIRIDER